MMHISSLFVVLIHVANSLRLAQYFWDSASNNLLSPYLKG